MTWQASPAVHNGCFGDFLSKKYLTLIGMRQGTFAPLVILGLDFVSWICIENSQTFLEVKIDMNQVNLTPGPAKLIESYKTCSQGALKMSIFLFYELMPIRVKTNLNFKYQ